MDVSESESDPVRFNEPDSALRELVVERFDEPEPVRELAVERFVEPEPVRKFVVVRLVLEYVLEFDP